MPVSKSWWKKSLQEFAGYIHAYWFLPNSAISNINGFESTHLWVYLNLNRIFSYESRQNRNKDLSTPCIYVIKARHQTLWKIPSINGHKCTFKSPSFIRDSKQPPGVPVPWSASVCLQGFLFVFGFIWLKLVTLLEMLSALPPSKQTTTVRWKSLVLIRWK